MNHCPSPSRTQGVLLTVNSSPLRQRTCLTRRGREGGLANELGGGAGELPARSPVSEANGGGVFLTDVPDAWKTQGGVRLVVMIRELKRQLLDLHS